MNARANRNLEARIDSLDGLRAFSILLVLIGHTAGTVGAPAFLMPLHGLGNYGVRFFFVISGFLITTLLLRELENTGRIDLIEFFRRRALRIFPAFYVYVGIAFLLASLGVIDLLPGDLFHAASYTMNYHHDRAWQLNHTWSLAVEEQFYLLWPLTLLALGAKRVLTALIIVVCLIPLIRAWMWIELDASPSAMTREFQAVADTLAFGCILAFARRRQWTISRVTHASRPYFWVGASCLFGVSAGSYLAHAGTFYILGQSFANLGTVLVVHLVVTQKSGLVHWILNHPLAIHMGVLSYSLYLWQEPFLNSYSTAWLASFPANILLTYIAALASYYLVEKRFLALKNRQNAGGRMTNDRRAPGTVKPKPEAPHVKPKIYQ